jgi:hypothetical protein
LTAPELVITAACCPDEEWAAVPSWPYEASTCGRVRSVTRRDGDRWRLGGPVASYEDKRPGKGYLYVTLTDGKRRRNAAVAVLVLEAHRKLRPTGYEACHENGVRTDNHVARLRWDTKAANRADRERHRRERPVTAPVTGKRANADVTGHDPSQEGCMPMRRRTSSPRHSPFHRHGFPGTGRFRPSILPRVIFHIRSVFTSRKAP